MYPKEQLTNKHFMAKTIPGNTWAIYTIKCRKDGLAKKCTVVDSTGDFVFTLAIHITNYAVVHDPNTQ